MDKTRLSARYVSYFICLFLLFNVLINHDMEEQESYFYFFTSFQTNVMNVACKIQLLFTVLFFSLWAKMRLPLCLWKRKKRLEEEGGEEGAAEEEEEPEEEEEGA